MLVGNGGDDRLEAGRGKDVIDCGSGTDRLVVGSDKRDTYRNCERIE